MSSTKIKWEIYTDGSTRNNGQENAVGGNAYLILREGVEYLRHADRAISTTNQRMELMAAINALTALDIYYDHINDEVIVYSDSAYLINCVQQKWWVNWQKNGWMNSKKQRVANKELWELLIPYFKQDCISWVKVQGHADNKYNNIVDQMAQYMSGENHD